MDAEPPSFAPPDGSTRPRGRVEPGAARAPPTTTARPPAGNGPRTRSGREARRARERGRGSPGAFRCARRPPAERRRGARSCTDAAGGRRAPRPAPPRPSGPAYMTTTRSARSATTPRLWVISTIAVPSRSRSSRRRSRIPAWIVTSSAVVGSSAIRIFGSQASAIAIITRWRIPPESWCGYSSTRRAGSGMWTRSSSSTTLALAALRETSMCSRTTSSIWWPIRSTGFSEVIGSWKTNEIWRPRTFRRRDPEAPSSSSPSKRTLPVTVAVFGRRPRIESAVTLLPQPDSPTIPSTCLGSSVSDIRSTAWTVPSSVSKRTERSSTSSSGALNARSWGRGRRGGRRRAG